MKIFGIIFAIVLIISLAAYFTIKDSNKINKLHKEYTNVSTEDEFSGKISNLYVDKGACFVTIESKKIFLKTSGNYLYPKIYLDRILSVGDSVVKKSGSDTIKVFKENSEYYFVTGRFINKSHWLL